MRRMMTAAAAIALFASAAQAGGNGKGGGHEGGGGHEATMQGGGHGGGKADRGGSGGHGGGHAAGAPREGGGSQDRGNVGHGNAHAERGNDHVRVSDNGNRDHGNRGNDHIRVSDNGPRGYDAQRIEFDDRGRGHDNRVFVVDRGRGYNDRAGYDDRGHGRGEVVRVASFGAIPYRGLIAGCPPGLAKKHNGCQPPGHARPVQWLRYDRPEFWGYRPAPGRYWYDDGYLVHLGPDGRAGGYIPLLGGALAIGNPWPTYYQPVALPRYYADYYGLGPPDAYRYADNVIYRVDPKTAAITSVAALLTGDDFVVGQPMPLGYDVYNVPYSYRTQYADGPDALYRYADGYVYRLDPKTRLIADAIELLAT